MPDRDLPPSPQSEAMEAVALLRHALARHGITLPDLGIDPSQFVLGTGDIRLGHAPAATVRKIAAALDRAS